jgi:hypothetical protein
LRTKSGLRNPSGAGRKTDPLRHGTSAQEGENDAAAKQTHGGALRELHRKRRPRPAAAWFQEKTNCRLRRAAGDGRRTLARSCGRENGSSDSTKIKPDCRTLAPLKKTSREGKAAIAENRALGRRCKKNLLRREDTSRELKPQHKNPATRAAVRCGKIRTPKARFEEGQPRARASAEETQERTRRRRRDSAQ